MAERLEEDSGGIARPARARRSAAVQAARSALASAGLPVRGLDGENGVTPWEQAIPPIASPPPPVRRDGGVSTPCAPLQLLQYPPAPSLLLIPTFR